MPEDDRGAAPTGRGSSPEPTGAVRIGGNLDGPVWLEAEPYEWSRDPNARDMQCHRGRDTDPTRPFAVSHVRTRCGTRRRRAVVAVVSLLDVGATPDHEHASPGEDAQAASQDAPPGGAARLVVHRLVTSRGRLTAAMPNAAPMRHKPPPSQSPSEVSGAAGSRPVAGGPSGTHGGVLGTGVVGGVDGVRGPVGVAGFVGGT